jgi:hypothetical protein
LPLTTEITLTPACGGIFDLVLFHQGRGDLFFPPSMVRPFDMLMVLSEVEAQAHHKWEGIKGRVKSPSASVVRRNSPFRQRRIHLRWSSCPYYLGYNQAAKQTGPLSPWLAVNVSQTYTHHLRGALIPAAPPSQAAAGCIPIFFCRILHRNSNK